MSEGATPAPSILHVTPYYPPDRIGGVGEVARTVHEALLARGHDSAVLSSGRSKTDPNVRRVGKSPIRFALLSWTAFRHARRFDIVHVHHGEALLLLLMLRLVPDRPAILLMLHVDVRRLSASERPHTVDEQWFGRAGFGETLRRATRFIRALMDRVSLKLADAVTVETQCLIDELTDLSDHRFLHVVPYGLGARSSESASQQDRVDLLYVGTPGLRKRTHLLPAVLAYVQQEIPEATMRVVGFEGRDDERMMGEAQRLGVVDSIDFAGRQSSEDAQASYAAAQALVIPSAYEGLPMVLLEAMRSGLPPVATNVSGHPEAIEDGVNGYLVPLDNPIEVARRCVDLLSDENRRREMGRQARATVEDRFRLEDQVDAYETLYRRLSARIGSTASGSDVRDHR